APITDEAGSLAGSVLAFRERDLSQENKAAETLQKSTTRLRQALRLEAIGRKASGLAHDLNNLLTVMLSHIAFAQSSTVLPAQVREALSAGEKAGQQAANLIGQLLGLGRVGAAHLAPLDLNDAIYDTFDMLRRSIGPGITISLDLAKNLGSVRADATQI